MYSSITLAKKYLGHRLHASGPKGHGIHSPFVYELARQVLDDHGNHPGYAQPEQLKKSLLQDRRSIEVLDLGAGSGLDRRSTRTIADIARHASKHGKLGRLLFRLAKFYEPGSILELGTSLGISTAYFASACPASSIITIEGAPAIAAEARNHFRRFGWSNIELVTGAFDQVLPGVLQRFAAPRLDLAYVDGNHRLEPTLTYFEQLLPVMSERSLILFDDIHWSAGMEEAWKKISGDPRVLLSVDLFFFGLVFFRPEFRVKQAFSIHL